MAECIIKKNGAAIDTSGLTAIPEYVKEGKTFLGKGSDDEQFGKMKSIPSKTHTLGINESLLWGAGNYEPGSKVTQNIPTLGQQNIIPSAEQQTVYTTNKYMSGDVVIAALPNLTSYNIKKGAVIKLGDVTIVGTYEGYENDDPYTPYYNGVFAPGQTITAFPAFGRKNDLPFYVGDVTLGRDNIHLENPLDTRYVTTAIVFNKPLNFNEINEIELTYSLNNGTGGCEMLAATGYVTDYIYTRPTTGSGKDYNEGLGTYYRREISNTSGNIRKQTINVSSVTGSRYIYISLFMRTTSSTAVVNMTLRVLECKK